MTKSPILAPNKSNKPHTHTRVKATHGNGKLIDEQKEVFHTEDPSSVLDVFMADKVWKKYVITYSFDKDAATEYYVFTGTDEDGYKFTTHVFSCYCEPLNVDQDPPF